MDILQGRMMQHPKSSASVSIERRDLNYQEAFPCPICRHGQVQGLTLMDAFSCNFCRHIFTANLNEQTVHVEDSSQPMTWRWNGRKWQAANQTDLDLSIVIWIVAIALTVLPPSLIWLPAQIFIPLDSSSENWFPTFWISLTFVCHFAFVAWLISEHYQLPFYVAGKVRIRRWLERFS